MFIISCKWIENSKLFQLLETICYFHPEEKIVVVDSDSEDKSYIERIDSNVIVEDISNKNYLEGALWYCFEKYQEENFFYLIHDSMILNDRIELKSPDISYFTNFDFAYNNQYGSQIMKNFVISEIETKTSYNYHEPPVAVFGSCIFVSRNFLERIKTKGFDKILPQNKMEMEAMERLWAIIIHQEGYDLEEIVLCKPNEFSNEKYIKKFWLGRQ
jgi:hypothetical protein